MSFSQNTKHWIFIRGLGRESRYWGDFIPQFKKVFPDDQIETLDLAGNGSERERSSFLSIAEYKNDLRRRCQSLQQGKKVHLMTISLASMVSIDWSLSHPDEIAGLVMMNTSDRRHSHFFERMQPHNLKFLGKLFRKANNETLSIAEKYALFPGTKRTNFFRQLIAASRYSFPVQKPNVPLLMLSSLQDQLVNPICSARIAQAWQIPHQIHSTAAHDIPLDDPAWVIESTKNWLSDLERLQPSLNI